MRQLSVLSGHPVPRPLLTPSEPWPLEGRTWAPLPRGCEFTDGSFCLCETELMKTQPQSRRAGVGSGAAGLTEERGLQPSGGFSGEVSLEGGLAVGAGGAAGEGTTGGGARARLWPSPGWGGTRTARPPLRPPGVPESACYEERELEDQCLRDGIQFLEVPVTVTQRVRWPRVNRPHCLSRKPTADRCPNWPCSGALLFLTGAGAGPEASPRSWAEPAGFGAFCLLQEYFSSFRL